MELNVHNLADYLRQTNIFTEDPIIISEINELADENDGFVNFIFRVNQNNISYIVKQARPYLRYAGIMDYLPTERNYLEYLSFVLRKNIVQNYVPKVFFADAKNNIFIMEDLRTSSRIMRFQLNEGEIFADFPRQISEFAARSHFYTSELYLDKTLFRSLQQKFFNFPMRSIMEDLVLMPADISGAKESALKKISMDFWANPAIRLATIKARDNFIKKCECLVHGDLHTSNIFINKETLHVIDMEYSFIGPFSYDLGYLTANFIAQYSAFNFKTHENRENVKNYLLDSIGQIYRYYFDNFRKYFEKDGKEVYTSTAGYLDALFTNILQESLAFMAVANMSRIINLSPYPDFDCIKDENARLKAIGLSLVIDEYFLLNSGKINSVDQVTEGIKEVQNRYFAHLY